MTSFYQKFLTYIGNWTSKGKVDYDNAYGYQCVDFARAHAQAIGKPIGTFGGSAINGWQSGVPFTGTTWTRVPFSKGKVPNP